MACCIKTKNVHGGLKLLHSAVTYGLLESACRQGEKTMCLDVLAEMGVKYVVAVLSAECITSCGSIK